MYSKLPFLTLLHVLLCSAVELEHFHRVSHDYLCSKVTFIPRVVSYPDLETPKEVARINCAKECLESKYICKFFILAEFAFSQLGCELYDKSVLKSEVSPVAHYKSMEIYEISDRYVEPLIKRFSYYDHHHMSVSQWEDDLFVGYDLKRAHGPVRDMIRVCKDAMVRKPSRAIDFEKWTSRTDLVQSQRTSFGVHPEMMMEYINTWQEYGEWEATPENFGTIMLAFLDIFCHSISPDVVTVYDPVKEILFINYNDRYVLVASFGPGDYVVIQNKSPTQPDPKKPVILVTTQRKAKTKRVVDLLQLFQRAMKQLDPSSEFEDAEYEVTNFKNPLFSRMIVLHNVIGAFLTDKHYAMIEHYISPLLRTFYQDLVTAVISRVYGSMQLQLGSQLKAMTKENKFGDIDVLTYH